MSEPPLQACMLTVPRPAVQLQKVMEMGFPEAEAREALDKFNGDENAAVNSLLGL